ncbi:MAG TPA: 4Fe-4S ferredoxin [Thermoplasmata archaeon]|jgi:heterodisulfide reductase subunit A-like polyferredoxin|nr:MAG TPA: 4Fe-4S ferredoxin [Thermoplasmata archaeon]
MTKEKKHQAASAHKHGSVLVIGGGISGIQSSLDLADAGFRVYIVDRGLSIGGTMTQLDKTFPTNDCAMCILAPKLVYTGRHPNISIITNAEVTDVAGEVGAFHVTLKKYPRFVDLKKCNGCGDCVLHCPVTMRSEFDEGLTTHKAIYQPFPQAIPNIFAITKNEGTSPCRIACPAGLNAHGFVALAAQEKFAEAYELIKETIPIPGSLGRICYHPCENDCNRKDIEEPISICHIRRFVADYIYEHPETLAEYQRIKAEKKQGKQSHVTKRGNDQKVAIIGAGPTGLTAAYDLARKGYKTVIFESEKYSGGMLHYGVPDYRLPKEYLHKEIDPLCEAEQIEIKNNQKLGRDFSVTELKKQGFKAVLLAIGAHKSRGSGIECCAGTDTCILEGVEYLKQLNRNMIAPEYFKGKTILVVGGGNVAMDSARTAKRLGGDVTVLYRRSVKEMPAHKDEIQQAVEEGILFKYLTAPTKLVKKENETCLSCVKMDLGEPDSSGRRRPVAIPDSAYDVPCDYVIFAIGQELDTKLLEENNIALSKSGFIEADPVTLQTSQEGVFAGGDAVTGPASAVEAIGAGHAAAESIDRFFNHEDLRAGREPKVQKKAEIPKETLRIPHAREQPPFLTIEERIKSFIEVDPGLSKDQVVREAQRCLNCAGCCDCQQCVLYCGPEAIDHQMKETTETIDVGAVIVSPGFAEYSPPKADSYGYQVYPNVLTSIEYERMLSASGPYKGHIKRISDGKPPKKIAWLQCIGSRDESCDRKYCSSVCCMYATKEAVISKEHEPGIETHIYYMDMRSFGKDFDKYFARAEHEYGVVYRRCRIPKIEQDRKTKELLIRYVDEKGFIKSETYDMVVLSVGLQPCASLGHLSKALEINLNEYGFIETGTFTPISTSREGIFASGTVTEPKDIPESVTQASAAAAEAGKSIADVRGTEVVEKTYPAERDIKAEFPRIGVFVCHCGINIAGVVDVKKVVEVAKKLPFVVHSDDTLFTCSQDSQEKIKEKIKELRLNRVVIASCTPRTHEPLFQDTLRQSGLNPHLFEMANLRDQNSWVHKSAPGSATEKAIDAVRMAVAKSSDLYPVHHLQIPVLSSALVIGGGIAGMTAALSIAEQGFQVYLVEKEPGLGGHLKEIYLGSAGEKPQELLAQTREQVMSNPQIQVFTNTSVGHVSGYVGNFSTTLSTGKKEKTPTVVQHGIIVVATGGLPYEPKEFHYKKNDDVLTQTEFEKDLFMEKPYVKNLKEVVMIQCVGSRNDDHPYCSRVCCSEALKNALRLKELSPDAAVYVLYRDIRTYGFREDFLYQKARKKGILFVRFDEKEEPKVTVEDGKLLVKTMDPILGRPLHLHPDRLVLSTGIIPQENKTLAQILKVPLNEDEFYSEAHVKLRPIDFSADGIFLCGLAHSPRFIEESILQAKATGARAATILSKKYLETIGNIARVISRNCAGCQLCIEACPYDAISFDEEKKIVIVNEILCQGCGACSAVCPSGTSQQNTFTKRQIVSMIDACLE